MYNNINSFANAVAQIIEAQAENYFPSTFEVNTVEIKEITKNNDQHLHGLLITKKGSNIAPNIYLESYYDMYKNGEEMETIIDEIARVRIDHDTPDINTDDLTDLDKVKDKITVRIFKADLNGEYLVNKPCKMVEDLAVTYAVNLSSDPTGQMTMPITYDLLKHYEISEEELDKIAMDNLAKTEFDFKSMYDILKEMVPEGFPMPPVDDSMYVLTNKTKVNGAAAILDKGIMDKIAEQLGCDFVIIPSSIHEVIILKVENTTNVDDLKEMIGDVNNTELDPKEVLSDHPYIYSRKNGLMSI